LKESLLGCLLLGVLFSGCIRLFDCADTVVKESVDPSVSMEQPCLQGTGEPLRVFWGATARLVTHVKIRKSSSPFKGSENSSVAGFDGECSIGLVWRDHRTLILRAEPSDMVRNHGRNVADEIRDLRGHPVIKVELEKSEEELSG
jgi:hypothetical protein